MKPVELRSRERNPHNLRSWLVVGLIGTITLLTACGEVQSSIASDPASTQITSSDYDFSGIVYGASGFDSDSHTFIYNPETDGQLELIESNGTIIHARRIKPSTLCDAPNSSQIEICTTIDYVTQQLELSQEQSRQIKDSTYVIQGVQNNTVHPVFAGRSAAAFTTLDLESGVTNGPGAMVIDDRTLLYHPDSVTGMIHEIYHYLENIGRIFSLSQRIYPEATYKIDDTSCAIVRGSDILTCKDAGDDRTACDIYSEINELEADLAAVLTVNGHPSCLGTNWTKSCDLGMYNISTPEAESQFTTMVNFYRNNPAQLDMWISSIRTGDTTYSAASMVGALGVGHLSPYEAYQTLGELSQLRYEMTKQENIETLYVSDESIYSVCD